MSFYNNLEELCKKKKITLAALARELGLSNSATTYWKRGSIPKYETLKKIADYFEVEVEKLLDIDITEEDVDEVSKEVTLFSREEVKDWLIEEAISDYPCKIYADAKDNAEKAIVNSFESISEKQLKETLISCYSTLNRLGRIEAVKRIEELAEIQQYEKGYEK